MEYETREKPLKAAYVEFAGQRFADGRARVERTGADSDRDWAFEWPGSADWHSMDFGERTLAKLILRDVFGPTTARVWHDVFQRDVVAKFNFFGWRITNAEVAAWHLSEIPWGSRRCSRTSHRKK